MGASAANQAGSTTWRGVRKRSNDLLGREAGDELRQAEPGCRVAPARQDLRQRVEDEGALCHPRMGKHRWCGTLAYQRAVGQEVEIEDPRRVGDRAQPSEAGLHLMEQGE